MEQQSVSQCVTTTASGVDNAASPDCDTAERDYFTLRERLITCAKQLEGTQKWFNELVQIELPSRWATHAIIVSNTQYASSGV